MVIDATSLHSWSWEPNTCPLQLHMHKLNKFLKYWLFINKMLLY